MSLDDDESEEYLAILERLARCMGTDEDGNLSNAAKLLLIKRARLLAVLLLALYTVLRVPVSRHERPSFTAVMEPPTMRPPRRNCAKLMP